jgi:pimeloyl-ACP methyl ester carboxylesterase
VLGELAFQIVTRDTVWLSRAEALQIVHATIPSQKDSEAILDALEATGTIQVEDDSIRFRHKSYCIVYAARALEEKLVNEHASQGELGRFLLAKGSVEVLDEVFQTSNRDDRKRLLRSFPQSVVPTVLSLVPSLGADLLVEDGVELSTARIGEALIQLKAAEFRFERIRKDIVVLLVHGFNTRGAWKNDLVPLLGRETDGERFIVHPWDYGEFRAGILNPWARRAKIRKFQEFYNNVISQYDTKRVDICAVVHSFGAYIIGRALLRFPEVRFDRLILAGSTLPRRFPWLTLKQKCHKVLNLVFGNDNALLLAILVPGLGASGRFGFRTSPKNVAEVRNPFGDHSDGFGYGNMRQTWVPFLRDGTVIFPYESPGNNLAGEALIAEVKN